MANTSRPSWSASSISSMRLSSRWCGLVTSLVMGCMPTSAKVQMPISIMATKLRGGGEAEAVCRAREW